MELSGDQRVMLWLSQAQVPMLRLVDFVEEKGFLPLWDGFSVLGEKLFTKGERERLAAFHSDGAMEELTQRLTQKGMRLLFRDDPAFPQRLREIPDSPLLLYYAGDLNALNREAIAIVGSRRCSRYGREMAWSLAKGFAEAGVAVVSGMAAGIDTAAHSGALAAKGVTIGILGSGLDQPYPDENRQLMRDTATQGGLVMSEYPPGTGPRKHHFPYRNRLISALSRGVVFVEGSIKSGALHTVDAALAQGKEVFAVPGQVGSTGAEGPHKIIREGATLVTCPGDVLEDLHLMPLSLHPAASAPWEGLSGLRREIVQQLSLESTTVQGLSEILAQDEDELLLELGMMEIEGLVVRGAGNTYRISTP